MLNYWARQRLLLTVAFVVILSLVTVFLFVFPCVEQNALMYNEQSIYNNTRIDFVAPEPSFDQVITLPGTNGIASVYPFYMTKTGVTIHGRERTTTVLIGNYDSDLELTMYNGHRLIEKSSIVYEKPVWVDWQFCHDTSSGIGDTVTITIGTQKTDYQIYAIYETNTLYSGGAVLIQVDTEQMNAIGQNSANNGYSGMYVIASEYDVCHQYLTSDYRPLGRLRNREQFSSDEQYQIHHDAIMDSGYANEITDFRVLKSNTSKSAGTIRILLGALLSCGLIISFNLILKNRGCESTYFTRQCIPAGKNVKPYYTTSFAVETVLSLILYTVLLLIQPSITNIYIPKTAWGAYIAYVPLAILAAEIFSLFLNYAACNAAKVATVTIPIKPATPMAKEQVEVSQEEAEQSPENQAEALTHSSEQGNTLTDGVPATGSKEKAE